MSHRSALFARDTAVVGGVSSVCLCELIGQPRQKPMAVVQERRRRDGPCAGGWTVAFELALGQPIQYARYSPASMDHGWSRYEYCDMPIG